ncbi:MAG TPA: methyltransferase domain-containing protein [Pyrinomonadaceae bacterium]|nr:methyltransferase domain-containing protein [Pyrinomonadaceae bacterium]
MKTYDAVAYRVGVRLGTHDELVPPRSVHCIGSGDFVSVGDEFFRYFVELCDLRPQDRVLDVGCGTGRMARPLTKYLRGGSYEGFDIAADAIDWCQKHITPKHPNFKFQVADVYNKAYNPRGKSQASRYRFPFPGESFDFVSLTSVFTHMLTADMENYMSEIARVLKPGGRCLITYLLLNDESRRLIAAKKSYHTLGYETEGCWFEDANCPEAVVGYDEPAIRDLYRRSELDISERIRFGSWCGRPDGMSWQDVVIAVKPEEI